MRIPEDKSTTNRILLRHLAALQNHMQFSKISDSPCPGSQHIVFELD